MFWLTWSRTPAASHASTSDRASSGVIASGFCARMPRGFRGWARIRRITPGCSSGGTATSTTVTPGSSSIASTDPKTFATPRSAATSRAVASVLEVRPTTRKPASA